MVAAFDLGVGKEHEWENRLNRRGGGPQRDRRLNRDGSGDFSFQIATSCVQLGYGAASFT